MKNVRKIIYLFLITSIGFWILTSINTIQLAYAPPGGTIYVSPKYNNFTIPPKNVGDWFTVNIRIANYSNVAGWQVRLLYNKNVLTTTDKNITYAIDHIFPGGTYPPIPASAGDFNSTHGYAMMTTTTFGAVEYNGADAGLMTVKFKILKAPSKCLLWFEPIDTWIIDTNIEELPEVLKNGYFEIRLPTPPPARIYVNPPKVVDASLTPCNNFNVNISIEDASYVQRFEFNLTFDPTVLHTVSAQLGNFFPTGIVPIILIDNTQGHVSVVATLRPSDTPASGDGTLAVIVLHVEALGTSDLNFNKTTLHDPLDYLLPHTTANGYFNNMLIPKLAVDPSEIADPTLVPPKTFAINITVAEVEDLYYYEFKLGYDANVIVCINLQINNVLGEINYVSQFSIDNIAGIAWVKVDYYEPAVPISTMSPVALVTITFRIRNLGVSILDLYDTALNDSRGAPMNPEVYDGIFTPLTRDVAIIDITPTVNTAYPGGLIKINLTALNKGDITETFDVTVYYEPTNLIGTLTFTNLAPSEQATLTITWNTNGVASNHTYIIWAEALPLPYEKNLTDNTLTDGEITIKIIGDANGDGKVDGMDLLEICKAFNSKPGSPRWNPEADFNYDSKVDGRDVAMLIKHFGKSY
jgi:hypothetical protein